jgi:nucleotide-binding universal stress UspA family protein
MKTILVPIDFSPVTKRVADAACRFARQTRSRLVLLHVVPIPSNFELYGSGNAIVADVIREGEKAASRKLLRLGQRCSGRGFKVRTIQHTGKPAPVILTKAAAVGADFIVIGSHGHGAVYDLLIGGTTQGVLRRAPCPVVVVPTRGTRK